MFIAKLIQLNVCFLFVIATLSGRAMAQSQTSTPPTAGSQTKAESAKAGSPSFTQGEATSDIVTLFQWKGPNPRTAKVGTIMSEDGETWTVPGKTHFESATKASDLYNAATGVTPNSLAEVDLEKIPVIDAGGDEVFTAYVFGDNYFELSINGKLLAVDPVPMTPFNSNIIRFKVTPPFTIGLMGVDWEEHLGLGFENFRGAKFPPRRCRFSCRHQERRG